MKWWDKISCIGLDEHSDMYHVRHVQYPKPFDARTGEILENIYGKLAGRSRAGRRYFSNWSAIIKANKIIG